MGHRGGQWGSFSAARYCWGGCVVALGWVTVHWGRLFACPNGWFPAPMGVNLPRWGLTVGGFLPRCRGWSREGSTVGLAAGRPGHQARLVGPVTGNGAARGSCGRADGGPGQPTAPPGAPGEGNAAATVPSCALPGPHVRARSLCCGPCARLSTHLRPTGAPTCAPTPGTPSAASSSGEALQARGRLRRRARRRR